MKKRRYRASVLLRKADGALFLGKAHPATKTKVRVDYGDTGVSHTFDPKTGKMLCCGGTDVFLGYAKAIVAGGADPHS